MIFEFGTYWIFAGLYGRRFAGEAAVPVGGEDVYSEKKNRNGNIQYPYTICTLCSNSEKDRK
jgi:hypothetical protein